MQLDQIVQASFFIKGLVLLTLFYIFGIEEMKGRFVIQRVGKKKLFCVIEEEVCLIKYHRSKCEGKVYHVKISRKRNTKKSK